MQRDLHTLSNTRFDLLVIGGGIFGACAAWDAAQRGLSVALIERHDFGGATSANSFKMIHGGIRYLQHGDVKRLRQSSAERRTLLRIAPHLVHPLPIVIPTYGGGTKGKAFLRAGMGLYDLLTLDRNRGLADPERRIPAGRTVSRSELLNHFPTLEHPDLTGAAIFHDAQMYNPPRLVLACVRGAVGEGAVAANHVEAIRFVREDGRISVVEGRDTLTGDGIAIRARLVLNATGPYAEHLHYRAMGQPLKPPGTYSRDACFVVPRPLLDTQHALAVTGRTHDPDAVLSRGNRHLFLVPWRRRYTLIGVWHVVHPGEPDGFTVAESELQRFIDEINDACPGLGLSLDDVGLWNAGLVPFGENSEGAEDLRYGHRSRLVDHAQTHGPSNLITLIGVRYTTGRHEAARAIDLACRKLKRGLIPSKTHRTPVAGGEIESIEGVLSHAIAERPPGISAEVIRSLVRNYGSDYPLILQQAEEAPALARTIGNSLTLLTQIRYAVRREMARTLADAVFRRTDLATGEYPGRHALAECAGLMAAELDWSHDHTEREIEAVIARFPRRAVRNVDHAGHAQPAPIDPA